jgi:uncharacterized membrane protein YedE/YeeE
MMSKSNRWEPYLAGAGIGVLEWFAFATTNKTLGVTTPFEHAATALWQRLERKTQHADTFIRERGTKPTIDWESMLVAGIPVGAYLAAKAEGGAKTSYVPATWRHRFGSSIALRAAGAFAGGALMMFGARMAKGCTSGHCISGTAQLSAASWLFSAVMGATAVAVTRLIFGDKR